MNRPRPRKQIVAKLTLFLLLGAIVNVAVAWGCAVWQSQENWDTEQPQPVPRSWPAYLQELKWPPPNSAQELMGVDPGVSVYEIAGGDPKASYQQSGPDTEKTYVELQVRHFGLPLRALQWETHGVRAGPRAET